MSSRSKTVSPALSARKSMSFAFGDPLLKQVDHPAVDRVPGGLLERLVDPLRRPTPI